MIRWVVGGLCVVLVGVVGIWILVASLDATKKSDEMARTGKGIAVSAKADKKKPTTSAKVTATLGGGGGFGSFSSPENEYEKGEVIVANPPERFIDAVRQLGFSVTERVQLVELSINLYRLRIPAGMNVPEARKMLRGRFPGLVVDANHSFQAQALKDYQKQVPRALIGWRKATPGCGGGIRLGMIDSPVDVTHPALSGQRIVYKSFHKKTRRPGKADHGTAIASMLVGKPNWGGLLPGAELMAANMFEVNETGRVVGSGVGLLKAVNWLARKRVQVINLSVAGTDNKVVRMAFERARNKGMIMVAAAGNWGKKGNKPAFPAAYKDVLAVTAFGAGRVIYSKANSGKYIDFAAPGVKVYTAVPGGGRLQSGTSFAAPFVSVLLALEIERGTARKPSALRKFMRGHTIDLGASGKDDIFGWGFVNLQPSCK